MLLVRSPGVRAARTGTVPARDDGPAGPLPDLTGRLGPDGRLLRSPAARAAAEGGEVEQRLRPWDLGDWAGRRLDALPPADLARWRADPAWRGHGGESLAEAVLRVQELLAEWHDLRGRVVAVTHAVVVRAAVLTALRAPLLAAWDLDVRPGSTTELHSSGDGWRVVHVGCAP